MMEDLENGSLEFLMVGEFLIHLKQEFGNGNNKLVKVEKLKKMEQENKMIKEFA